MGEFSNMVSKIGKVDEPVDTNCQAYGCPLDSIFSSNFCSYHQDCNDLQKTTHAINMNGRWINGYSKMVKWNQEQWTRYIPSLLTNEFLPMEEGETPSVYLTRYHFKLMEVMA